MTPDLPLSLRLLTTLRGGLERLTLVRQPPIDFDPRPLRSLDEQDVKEALYSTEGIDWDAASSALSPMPAGPISGGVNPGDRRALYQFVRWLNPISVLEIGTHVAASTVYIAKALLAAGEMDGFHRTLTTVDVVEVNQDPKAPWKELGLRRSPSAMLEAMGVLDVVDFVRARSDDFLRATEETYDLVFIDGLHTAAQTYTDIALSSHRLNKGGVILLHDFFPRMQPLWDGKRPIVGPYLAVRRLMHDTRGIDVLPVGELPWETKLGSHASSLAFLIRSRERT